MRVPYMDPDIKQMLKKTLFGTFLVVQWLRLHTPGAGGPGSISGQGTRSHMLQLRVCMMQLRTPQATKKTEDPSPTTKTQRSQINI